ncbi:MAG: GatB/YqeY domain-containing protein [Bacteroidota bacterium]|nr:GatB/YqeY domain-containing protein [Bacteroidota bacterium]
MTLNERIMADLKEALRAGRTVELMALRSIRAGILEVEKKRVGTVLTEEDELAVLSAAAKKRREAIEQYRSAGREDLARKEEEELAVISRYLPQPLTDEELETLATGTIARLGAAGMGDFGKVMGALMKTVRGRAEGERVHALVRRLLGGS